VRRDQLEELVPAHPWVGPVRPDRPDHRGGRRSTASPTPVPPA